MATRTFEQLLAPYSPDIQALARQTKDFVLKVLPAAEETVDGSTGVVAYGYGPGYKGTICTLILSRSGVKLGLVRGAELSDPLGLLAGSGKVHRYVSLQTPADLRKPGLTPLVSAAVKAWKARTGGGRSS